MSDQKKIGPLGEELVAKFLMKRGYRILDRNYRRPWGELDVVAEKKKKIHFVEVKTLAQNVSDETTDIRKEITGSNFNLLAQKTQRKRALAYIRYAKPKDWFRPEDQMSRDKITRLSRIIQTYLMGSHVSNETDWQFDVAAVLIDSERKVARVTILEDITLERY